MVAIYEKLNRFSQRFDRIPKREARLSPERCSLHQIFTYRMYIYAIFCPNFKIMRNISKIYTNYMQFSDQDVYMSSCQVFADFTLYTFWGTSCRTVRNHKQAGLNPA